MTKENRKRVNFILDLNKPREKVLADYLEVQFSISGTVKEALEEKMLRENGSITDAVVPTVAPAPAPATKKVVVEKKEEVVELGGIDSMMDI